MGARKGENMLPDDILQLQDLTQTITVVFLLTVAVLVLWRKWSEERKAREVDVHRYEQQMEELRKAFERSRQDMINEYVDDMRYLAGMKDADWGMARPSHLGETRPPHSTPEPGSVPA
jgi:hypothetical protein